jgi:hypothetical protein
MTMLISLSLAQMLEDGRVTVCTSIESVSGVASLA